LNRAFAVNRIPWRVSLRDLNRGSPHFLRLRAFPAAALPLAQRLAGFEEPPVRRVQVRDGLLENDGADLPEPRARRGALRCGERGRQVRVGDVRQPGRVRVLPCAQAVVEHDPGAPERAGQRGPLTRCRVQTVVVPELHLAIIFVFMAVYRYIRPGRHCVSVLHAHLVFVTRYRHQVFTARHLERPEEIMRDVCADFETGLAEFNGASDHVHLLVNFPPKVALSRLVNSLKGVPSRRMRQEFPPGITGVRTGCGPDRTPPDQPAAHRSASCATTSSGRTGRLTPAERRPPSPPARRPAPSDILVADPGGLVPQWRRA
jgi:putative transposase